MTVTYRVDQNDLMVCKKKLHIYIKDKEVIFIHIIDIQFNVYNY